MPPGLPCLIIERSSSSDKIIFFDVEERGVARGVARVLVVSHVEYPPLDVESELREVHRRPR